MTGGKDKIIEHYLKEFDEHQRLSDHFCENCHKENIKWLTSTLNEVLLDENELVDYFAIYDAKNGTTTLNPDDFWAYSEKEQQDLAWTLAKAITAKQIPNKLTNKSKQARAVGS